MCKNSLQFSERGVDIHLVGTSGNFCTMQEVHNDLFNITFIISSVSTFDFASFFGEKLEPHYDFPLRFSDALMGLSGGSGPPVRYPPVFCTLPFAPCGSQAGAPGSLCHDFATALESM